MPKINSIPVIIPHPKKALVKRDKFLNLLLISLKITKQMPPAENILQWVCPRHRISIIPYRPPPMEKSTILRFLSLILSPVILLDDKAFICKKEIGKPISFKIKH